MGRPGSPCASRFGTLASRIQNVDQINESMLQVPQPEVSRYLDRIFAGPVSGCGTFEIEFCLRFLLRDVYNS
jgi:hypothetical protein